MSAWLWIGVAVVGGFGAILRFLLDGFVGGLPVGGLPLGTLVVNLSGTLALGFLAGLGARGNVLLLVGTAALGSYTTFSTWMLETYRLAEDNEPRPALLNVALSLVLGFGAALLGRTIGLAL